MQFNTLFINVSTQASLQSDSSEAENATAGGTPTSFYFGIIVSQATAKQTELDGHIRKQSRARRSRFQCQIINNK